jgi:RimJ/RimL family protein N-acetyltransferase
MRNPYLIGNSVWLRPVEISDAQLIQKWHNDPELRKLAGAPRLVSTLTDEEEDIKNASKSDDEVYLMIVKKEDDKSVGFIRLNGLSSFERRVWLRISIGNKASWGKGYGSDAMRYVLKWLFYEMNIHRVELETYSTNERALKFFEYIGFKREGIRREAHFANGRYYDIVCFGLLRGEFK